MSQESSREINNENNRQNQNPIQKVNTNQDTIENPNPDPNTDAQQEQPGFFSRFKNLFYMFIVFQIISALFGSKMKNSILFQNSFDDDTLLNINFYIDQSKFPLDYDTITKKD